MLVFLSWAVPDVGSFLREQNRHSLPETVVGLNCSFTVLLPTGLKSVMMYGPPVLPEPLPLRYFSAVYSLPFASVQSAANDGMAAHIAQAVTATRK